MTDDELMVLAAAAFDAGLAVSEIDDDQTRAGLLEQTGAPNPGSRGWARVRERLRAQTASRAGHLASRCSACSAPIVWAVVASTWSRMPMDPLPHPKGNVELTRHAGGLRAVVARQGDDSGPGPRYRAHFATCPAAASRRSRPSRKQDRALCEQEA